jgi:EAL domain-containing protein (putative c-di-GMP-specific phosphodiesterase class I)
MSQPKILISEDHSLTRQALVASLNSLGFHNIITAANNEKALQVIFLEKEIDILICSLPTSNSQKLIFLRHASQYGHINSILLISDISPSLTRAIGQFAKYSGYELLGILRKPLNRADLKSALSAYKPKHTTSPTFFLAEMPSADDIADSLHKSEFVPYYQPKLDLDTGQVVGAEILMRWNHPQLGLLGPAAFIEVARHFGHLDAMTLEVLTQAIKFIATQNFGSDFKIAVNIDPEQLSNPTLHEKIAALLFNENANPSNLIIEITETGLLESPANAMENLVRLRMLGCGVSIDDFGAGLSSLQRICELPCTEIKMDMSFSKALMRNERNASAIEAMVHFSDAIGVQLVIEGIETGEQLTALQKLKCHIGQGYFISAPIPGDKLAVWIESQDSNHPPKQYHYDSK